MYPTKLPWLWIAFVLSLIDLCHSIFSIKIPCPPLWIAFVLSLIDLCHSWITWLPVFASVVNCFRSFTYWPLSQYLRYPGSLQNCCELLSFFHLLTFVTVKTQCSMNCLGCELLSFFHLLTFVTVMPFSLITCIPLWIAFVLSLIDLCHSLPNCLLWGKYVVNCFRSFTYWPLSQLTWATSWILTGCELLSFFHLLTFVTVSPFMYANAVKLWIAFVLSLIDLCHSRPQWQWRHQQLWIAFVLSLIDLCHSACL